MTPARWTFVVIFGLGLLMGLVIGLINLVAPDAANVTLNGAKVTGIDFSAEMLEKAAADASTQLDTFLASYKGAPML